MENSKCFLRSSAVWAMGPCTRRRKRKELNTDRQGKMNKQKPRKGMRREAISTQEPSVFFTCDRDLLHMLAVDIKGQISVGIDQCGSLGLY